MKFLVTGSAGFIGFHLTKALLQLGHEVVGIDNLNDYYDPALKESRLKEIARVVQKLGCTTSYTFQKLDIADQVEMEALFNNHEFDRVVHLAAQAGVRYSIESPRAYVNSNLVGFVNLLEGCRQQKTAHLVYASSSSVYGMSTKVPFSTGDRVDCPISLYAATKKSNELMAHTYSHLFGIPTTGLRFFTVYGPWGRPDMAYFSFTEKILKGQSIDVFNNGEMKRDFTYVDDIVEGIVRIVGVIPERVKGFQTNAEAAYAIYNIGNNTPVKLDDFIKAIESATDKEAKRKNQSMQPGDVPVTYADTNDLERNIGYKPNTSISDGILKFVEWYKGYYKV